MIEGIDAAHTRTVQAGLSVLGQIDVALLIIRSTQSPENEQAVGCRAAYLVGQETSSAQSFQMLQVEAVGGVEGSLVLIIAAEVENVQEMCQAFGRVEFALEDAAGNLLLVRELRSELDHVVERSPVHRRWTIRTGDGEQVRDQVRVPLRNPPCDLSAPTPWERNDQSHATREDGWIPMERTNRDPPRQWWCSSIGRPIGEDRRQRFCTCRHGGLMREELEALPKVPSELVRRDSDGIG